MCGKQPNLSTYICRQLNKNRGEKNKVDTTFSSVAHSCPTPCDPMDCSTWASLSITNSWSLLKLMSTELVIPSNHLTPLSPSPAFNISLHQGIFQWGSSSHKVAKYWSLSFNSPSNEHSGLISFRMDWLDLFAVQGTLKSSPTPQFKTINSSVLSFLYRPTLTSIHDYWKNHSLD